VISSPLPAESPIIPDPLPPRRSGRERKVNQKFHGEEWVHYQSGRAATQRVKAGDLNGQYLQSLSWSHVVTTCQSADLNAMIASIERHSTSDGDVEWLHPLAFAARANAEDNPTWNEAMNGPHKEGYWDAMCREIDTLTVQKHAWDVVDREPWMNVLPSTWAFKCKRYPDGLIKKLKARFCVRGDRQKEGVDFFDTFAPVVNWTTVRLMLVLSLILDLDT